MLIGAIVVVAPTRDARPSREDEASTRLLSDAAIAEGERLVTRPRPRGRASARR